MPQEIIPKNINFSMEPGQLLGRDGIEVTVDENNNTIIGLAGAGSRLIKYERSDIEFGIDGEDYSWDDNLLTCEHNLGVQLPFVSVYVTPKTGTAEEVTKLELAIVPHSYIRGNMNKIVFDLDGFQDFFITIKLVG